MLTCFSVCTGGGGFDMAAEMAGFEIVAQCEIDPYCNMLLEMRYPGMPYWEDLRHVTARKFSKKTGIAPGELTLLAAGIPCQPHSLAGPRKGSADERDLKDILVEKVRGIRPRWVLVENVRGILSSDVGRYFGDLLRQMAELGYDAVWCSYKASQVGAKQNRERVWIAFWRRDVAKSFRKRCGGGGDGDQKRRKRRGESVANAEGTGPQERQGKGGNRKTYAGSECSRGTVADSKSRENIVGKPLCMDAEKTGGKGINSTINDGCTDVARTEKHGLRSGQRPEESERERRGRSDDGSAGSTQPGLGGTFDGLADWLDSVGWIADKGEAQRGITYPWEPPRTARGIKDRARRIKIVGNGIVPQQGFIVLEAIVEIEGLLAEYRQYGG